MPLDMQVVQLVRPVRAHEHASRSIAWIPTNLLGGSKGEVAAADCFGMVRCIRRDGKAHAAAMLALLGRCL